MFAAVPRTQQSCKVGQKVGTNLLSYGRQLMLIDLAAVDNKLR